MSKAKSKSKSKKKVAAKKAKPTEVEVPVDGEAQDEMSAGEKFMLASKPYWPHILLGVLSLIFASVLWTAWGNLRRENASEQWRELSNAITQANLTNDTSSLKEMGGKYIGEAGGNWALQMAGNIEVNRGIDLLTKDRPGGVKLIELGIESLQKVVDAPATSKSPMLQRRSLFMLAYGKEALGKFEEAKASYETLLDAAPDSPFTDVTRRGLARVSNPELTALYDKFRSWEEATDVAPGALVPEKPQLPDPDTFKLQGASTTFGGGDFGGNDMKKDETTKPEMKSDEMKSDEMKSDDMKSDDKKDAAEMEEKAMPADEVTPKAEPEVEMPKSDPPAEAPKAETEPASEMPDKVEKAVEAELPEVETPEVETPEVKPETPEVESETGGDGDQ